MPINSYSPCPGGSGKKIKFCCPDLLGELQKIERMLEGEQYLACLKHIEGLERQQPDRACLLATKTLLLRMMDRIEEAEATAARFVEKHPDNPLALAESAMIAGAAGEPREAMEWLERAITASGGKLHHRVYEAMGAISRGLAAEGQILAARALATMQLMLRRDDPRVMELLVQLNSLPSIPAVLKDERGLVNCPEGVPWKAAFEEAVALSRRGHWSPAIEQLAALAREVDDAPAIWQNLAVLRGWRAETSDCIEAWRRYAALDVPLEDAVEAETLCLFLSDDPLGDPLDVSTITYEVKDAERLQAALTAAPRAGQVPVDPAPVPGDDGPPPKTLFFLFDRDPADSGEEPALESLSRVLCRALLYGRETDREARLEVTEVVGREREEVQALLDELVGDELGPVIEEEVTDQVSATQELLTRNWRLPEGLARGQFQQFVAEYLDDALLNRWPQSALGFLEGKSPEEAAGEEACRIKVLAAVMLVEFWLEQTGGRFDCNRLRSRLGLPTLDSIDPGQFPLDDLPLVRLSRVEVEKLSDEDLITGYRRVRLFNVQAALPKFARAVAERPSLADHEERLRALVVLTRTADDSEEALGYLEQGRQAARRAGLSSASWDLMELSFRFERREGDQIRRLLEHLQSEHMQEPGVAQALAELLVEAGVIRPDGTPVVPAAEMGPEESSLVVPGEPGAKPGELWTPESQKPAGEKPAIWTPDQG